MPLKLKQRGEVWWIRGAVRGTNPDGQLESVSIYQSTGTRDRSVAEAIRAKTEARILDGIVFGKAKVVTFRQAAEEYIAAGGSGRYVMDVKADGSESGLIVHFGDTLLGQINQDVLDRAAKELYPTASPETLNRQVYTPFIAIWNHAFASSPGMARKWRRPRKPKGTNVIRVKRKRAGTTSVEFDRAAKLIASMSPAPAMLTAFLFYTGMRPIEAFALEAENVDVKNRWIVIPNSKTGESRGVPLHDFLAGWLPDLVARGGALFRTPRGERYIPVEEGGGGLKSAINGARRRSGITDISPYSARHTVSTALVVAGVHPHIKDQILGHAADDMSRHYTSVPQAPLIEAINKLPVPDDLRALPWVASPKDWWSRLAEGTGKRTDLEKRRAKAND